MDLAAMRRRAPGARLVAPARLKDHRIAFGAAPRFPQGFATVLPGAGSEVWGLLLSLRDEDLAKLDRYEGYPKLYNRVRMAVVPLKGGPVEAWVYAMRPPVRPARPNRDHLNAMRRAAARWEFPPTYQKALLSLGRPQRPVPASLAPVALGPAERRDTSGEPPRGPVARSAVGGLAVRRRRSRELPDWLDELDDV